MNNYMIFEYQLLIINKLYWIVWISDIKKFNGYENNDPEMYGPELNILIWKLINLNCLRECSMFSYESKGIQNLKILLTTKRIFQFNLLEIEERNKEKQVNTWKENSKQ